MRSTLGIEAKSREKREDRRNAADQPLGCYNEEEENKKIVLKRTADTRGNVLDGIFSYGFRTSAKPDLK